MRKKRVTFDCDHLQLSRGERGGWVVREYAGQGSNDPCGFYSTLDEALSHIRKSFAGDGDGGK